MSDEGRLGPILDIAENILERVPSSKLDLIVPVIMRKKGILSPYDLEGITSPAIAHELAGMTNGLDEVDALALCAAISMKKAPSISDKVRICVSGNRKGIAALPTWPTLEKMLLDAEDEVVIVGYAIKTDLDVVLDSLVACSRRGVRLTFLINDLHSNPKLIEWLESLPYRPNIFFRPKDPADGRTSLHIKCVIVDGKKAMFGSANLTEYGMKMNIEMNLAIEDEVLVQRMLMVINSLKAQLLVHD